MGKKLSDEVIVAALLKYPTVGEACEALGIGETTMRRRRKEEGFKKLYRDTCRDMLKGHTMTMQTTVGDAVETLREIATDRNTAAGVRVSAADSILRNAMKMTEQMDIIERIEELEGDLL